MVIQLSKGPEPSVLATNKVAWTAEFEAGVDRRRYAHQEIRDALIGETARKCAYCESRMEHVAPSNVEHMVPKSVRTNLVCEWTNLTLACPTCNTKKGDYYDDGCPLLNPYEDDPDDHLRWVGPMVFAVTPDRGRVTRSRLALNRSELLFQRGQRIDRARELLELIADSAPAVGRALGEDLRSMQLADAEYSAAVRAFIAGETTQDESGSSAV